MFLSWRSRSCVLWLLHPCPSLHAQERSFPLWRCISTDAGTLCVVLSPLWRCVCTDAWTVGADLPMPSLPRGVTEGLIGLIPSSCLHSLPWIMASGPLSQSSFVFWDFNKYLSWTCNWIRIFPWQNSQTRNRFSRSTHSQDRCDTTGHSPWPAFHPVNSHLKGSWPTDSPGSWT